MLAVVIVIAALAGWEALVQGGVVDSLLLPAPTEVASSLWNDRALLGADLAVTLQEVLVGLLAAVAISVGAGSRKSSTPPNWA